MKIDHEKGPKSSPNDLLVPLHHNLHDSPHRANISIYVTNIKVLNRLIDQQRT